MAIYAKRKKGEGGFIKPVQSVEKLQVGRRCPQTALCGPPRVSAAKPCTTLVLGYALHGFQPFLALVGLRPPFSAAKPCATLVLGYALHGFQPFLALVGLRQLHPVDARSFSPPYNPGRHRRGVGAQWAQPPQVVSDPQVCHETREDYGSSPRDD